MKRLDARKVYIFLVFSVGFLIALGFGLLYYETTSAGLRYKIHCIENDIPYLGFFDPVFSPERPFTL